MPGDLTRIAERALAKPRVSCSFLRVHRRECSIDTADVAVPTGSSPWVARLSDAAHTYAHSLDYRMWAIPVPGAWWVYEHGQGGEQAPRLLKHLPTREAAEMWMLHSDG